jgi:hypothetical protein
VPLVRHAVAAVGLAVRREGAEDRLAEYARTPARFTPVKSDPLLRLLIADLVGEGPTRESLIALREDIADLRVRVRESEQAADEFPHRRKYLLLVAAHLNRLLDLHEQLVADAERELAPEP